MVDTTEIKNIVDEFFNKMTLTISTSVSVLKKEKDDIEGNNQENIEIDIKSEDPQILIGEGGQTLLEIQKILRSLISKKTGQLIRLNIDINDYKKRKIDYLKGLARDLADEVFITKKPKILMPMPSYERRAIHVELANRTDILTESDGEGDDRKVIIKPR